ncbi:MAG: 4Fe-4S dicluster domain-containing protein [Deltaproteobacteria bacterium]|nr:4Fe-4S dicluster domain-containing protein [Deltaproteobacteria bacterium]
MAAFVSVNPTACTGCRECEMVCSLVHFGECNPDRSAIRVLRKEAHGLVAPLPLVCQHCDRPACVPACPADALTRTESGLLAVDRDACTGCGECIEACPAGCIFQDVKSGEALACDLCGGEPQCVPFCHAQCLTVGVDTGEPGERRVARLAEVKAMPFPTAATTAGGAR